MTKRRDEVCLYYMGFGLCAKGFDASDKGKCSQCSHYAASDQRQNMAVGGAKQAAMREFT